MHLKIITDIFLRYRSASTFWKRYKKRQSCSGLLMRNPVESCPIASLSLTLDDLDYHQLDAEIDCACGCAIRLQQEIATPGAVLGKLRQRHTLPLYVLSLSMLRLSGDHILLITFDIWHSHFFVCSVAHSVLVCYYYFTPRFDIITL